MRKGEVTRSAILDASLTLAARSGLDGLTIGALAEATGMSKSGVFAHFGSREDLQIATLRAYEQRFVDEVLAPALGLSRGLPRLVAIFGTWLDWMIREVERGCLYVSGATEFDDQPGPVRDELVLAITSWQQELNKALSQAITVGDLREGTDLEQVTFEMYGIMLSLHHSARLLRRQDSRARARIAFHSLLSAFVTEKGRQWLQQHSVAGDKQA